jgi:hypothetical protein
MNNKPDQTQSNPQWFPTPAEHPSKRDFDLPFEEVPGFRRRIFMKSQFEQQERAHPHANGNGQSRNADPVEHYPLAHLGSDLIVRPTSAVINHKADDGRPEI